MAHILTADLAITRNEKTNQVTAVRFMLKNPLFGEYIPDEVDGIMIENNGAHWLGHTLNLDIDGDEVMLNVQLDDSEVTLTKEIADFIKTNGVVEIIEFRVDPSKLIDEYMGWEPRSFQIPVQYFETTWDFVREYRFA